MQSSPPPVEDRAICASHPLISAVFTCERCGSFGCESCRSTSSPTVCQTCSLRVAPAPREAPFTVGALLADSFRLLARNLPGLALLLGFELSTSLLFQLFPDPETNGVLLLVSACVGALGTAVFLSWTKGELLQEPERSLVSALLVGLRRFPLLAIMSWIFGPLVGCGTLLLVLPGVYLVGRLSLAAPLLVFEGHGPMEALSVSFERTRAHGVKLLGVFAVVFPLVLVSSFLSRVIPSALFQMSGTVGFGLGRLIGDGVLALSVALFQGTCLLVWMRLPESVPSTS